MASDTISMAIIGIASLIIVSTLVATLLPQVFDAAGFISSASGTASDRLGTSITVVSYDFPAPGELQFDVLNNGKASLAPSQIDMSVLYLYNHSMPGRILAPGASPDAQYWEYAVSGDGDGEWDPGEVLTVTAVSPAYDFGPGEYTMKMLLYNSAAAQYSFTI